MVFLRPWGVNDLARAKSSQVGVEPDCRTRNGPEGQFTGILATDGTSPRNHRVPLPFNPPALAAESENPLKLIC